MIRIHSGNCRAEKETMELSCKMSNNGCETEKLKNKEEHNTDRKCNFNYFKKDYYIN